jgi:hypothetical protein
MASGEMSEGQFTTFLSNVYAPLCRYSTDGSIHQICMDWRHMREMLAAGDTNCSELKNVCVWNKTNAGMGTFYRSKHEMVFVWKNGSAPHLNTFELGQYGRHRTNVWDYDGVNTLRAGRMDELAMHPTVKCRNGCRCDQGLLQAGESHSRSLLRQWNDPDRRGKDRSTREGNRA